MHCKRDDSDKICSDDILHCGLNDGDFNITNPSAQRHHKFRSEIFVLVQTCDLSDSRFLRDPKLKKKQCK